MGKAVTSLINIWKISSRGKPKILRTGMEIQVEIIFKSHSDRLNLKEKIMTKITTIKKEA